MKMPQKLLVYVCGYDDDRPLFAAVTKLSDIPEDEDGEIVAEYNLSSTKKFKVTRSIE